MHHGSLQFIISVQLNSPPASEQSVSTVNSLVNQNSKYSPIPGMNIMNRNRMMIMGGPPSSRDLKDLKRLEREAQTLKTALHSFTHCLIGNNISFDYDPLR